MELDILFIVAHPDDAEISSAGTISLCVSQGYSVGIVDLTAGELGTRGSAKKRHEEAQKSSNLLGLKARINLGMADGFFQHNQEHLFLIIKQIRDYKPKIVITNAVSDRHPDHGRASKLVSEACFLSGLRKIATSLHNELQECWKPMSVYHMIQDRWIAPDFVVDISTHFKVKMDAIRCFDSQFYDPDSDELATPISSPYFFSFIEGRCLQAGRLIGVKYGEGYTVERPTGVKDILTLL